MASLESRMHYFAKLQMAAWLREIAEKSGYDNNAGLGHISWRVNRRGPRWGVWTEYPVTSLTAPELGCGFELVWDETGWWMPKEALLAHNYDAFPEPANPIPTYEQLCDKGTPPKFIFDVAIQHKGDINTLIEIVHKNPPSPEKVNFVRSLDYSASLWVVPATWVMAQVRRPTNIPSRFRVA